MTSRVLQVIDGLVTAFETVTIDGTVTKAWEILPVGELEHIFVAGRGAEFGEEDVANATIDWPGLSPLSRTEGGSVDCAISVTTGDQEAIDATINRAYTIFDDCEAALRVDPSLGITTIALQAKITESSLRVAQGGEGLLVLIPFTVSYLSSQ